MTSSVPPVSPIPPTRTFLKVTMGSLKPPFPSPPHEALASATAETSASLNRILTPNVCSGTRRLIVARRLVLDLGPPCKTLADLLFEAEAAGLVEHGTAQLVGKILLRNVGVLRVVRVVIPFVISQFLHQRRRRVANVQRHALG